MHCCERARVVSVAITLVWAVHITASAQGANIVFPPNCGVVDVTQAPYNADNTGQSDATAAIQAALDANKTVIVIYLPNGTYKVSNTLRCATYETDADNAGPIIVGQNRRNTVIRLADGTFADQSNPRPVLLTGDGVAQNFDKAVHNLTVSVGRNNPGANGIYFYANNMGLISEVDIISEDGQGVKGLDLGYGEQGPCGAKSVYVKGFQYGVYSAALNGVACSQITVEGQSVCGVMQAERYLWIDSLTSINSVPAVINKWDLLLVDADLRGGAPGTAAIRNESGGNLFLRGIKAQGYGSALSGMAGTTIDEYSSRGYERLWTESPEHTMGLPISRASEMPWEEDPARWGNASTYKGGLGQPQRSDQAAVQAAIDDPKNKVVFVPGTKVWSLTDTLYVRGGIQRFVGGAAKFHNASGAAAVVVTDECTEPVICLNWIHGVPVVNRSSKSVIIQSVHHNVVAEGSGELRVIDMCGGLRVRNPQQKVWVWHFNAEGLNTTNNGITSELEYNLWVEAGQAWIFGWKDEGGGEAGVCEAGLTEILGLLQYTGGSRPHPSEFTVRNAAFSLAGHSEVCFSCGGGLGYSTLVTEERDGVTRYFRDSDNGGDDNYGVFTGYRPDDLQSVNVSRKSPTYSNAATVDRYSVAAADGRLRVPVPAGTAVRVLNWSGRIVARYAAAFSGATRTIDGLPAGAYVVQLSTVRATLTGQPVVDWAAR